MKMSSKTLGAVIAVVIFGGIAGASALGLWKPKAGGTPATIQASQGAGRGTPSRILAGQGTATNTPADIRGNHRFDEISTQFDIPLETLSRAFALPADVDAASFQNQDFETIYPEFEGEEEIGNGSMQWFVALYTGLPYVADHDDEDTYLLRPAVDILKSHADLTAEQIAYLDTYVIELGSEECSPPADELQASEPARGKVIDEMIVAGQTNFADLLEWGVPVERIEAIIGGEIPNRLTLVRDYCTENRLPFGRIKTALQAEVDKLAQ